MVIFLLEEKHLWIFHQIHPVNIKQECRCQMLLLACHHHVPFPSLLCLPWVAVCRNVALCILKAEIIHWVAKKMLIPATE